MKYKAVILVLSSDDECLSNTNWSSPRIYPLWKPMFPFFKNVWEQYHDSNPDIKVFYVYGQTTVESAPHNLIFNQVKENNYPGMITKTLLAMDFINQEVEYDFLIRTNLSTFWNLNTLVNRLDELPLEKCLTGTIIPRRMVEQMTGCRDLSRLVPDTYIAGYDMVMSRDIVSGILPHSQSIINNRVVLDMEDLSLCEGISNYLDIVHLPFNIADQAVDMNMGNTFDDAVFLKRVTSSIDNKQTHFRVKNRLNRNVDKIILTKLLDNFYH